MRLPIPRRRMLLAIVILIAALSATGPFRSYMPKSARNGPAVGEWVPPLANRPEGGCPALDPDAETPGPSAAEAPGRTTTRFVAIGDYGYAGPAEQAVADLVKAWRPEFIVTLGDNN